MSSADHSDASRGLVESPASHGLTTKELSDFIPVLGGVPVVASGFAVAFNVGYFLAYDISWLPFFSLSEHVVFALRALPIAIAASVAFLIACIYPPKVLGAGLGIWIFILITAAVIALLGAHVGLFLVFLLVAYGAFRHHKYPSKSPSVNVNILYYGTSVMLLSLMVGYGSAIMRKPIWSAVREFEVVIQRQLPLVPSMCIELKNVTPPSDTSLSTWNPHAGQAIFAGSEGVLFHDYRDHLAHLFKWDQIQNIHNCSRSELDAVGLVADIPG